MSGPDTVTIEELSERLAAGFRHVCSAHGDGASPTETSPVLAQLCEALGITPQTVEPKPAEQNFTFTPDGPGGLA